MSNTKGVIYFNQGQKCVNRIIISIFSLRKHYKGNITLMTIGEQDDLFIQSLKPFDVNVLAIDEAGSDPLPPLVQKARLWRFSPYDLTMFIDADTIICADISEYFDKVKEYGFCTGEFAGWKTTGGSISKRIRGFATICDEQVVQDALDYGKATNTGIFGFTKTGCEDLLLEWEKITYDGWKNNCSRIPDEVGCQMLLPKYKHWLAPPEWGASVKYGEYSDIKIIHYHGRKHTKDYPRCSVWKQHFWEYMWTTEDINAKAYIRVPKGDRRFSQYLKKVDKQDLTFVTLLTPGKYEEKFFSNIKEWLKTEGIIEYPIHVHILAEKKEESLRIVERIKDMGLDKRLVVNSWSIEKYIASGWSARESCFYIFTNKVPFLVDTPKWVKLDCDTYPKEDIWNGYGYVFDWERGTRAADVASHKWGYTKPGKWLCTLETWADTKKALKGTSPIFADHDTEAMLAQKRYGHPRINSFLSMYSTAFSRECAKIIGNRLPVPSQDTTIWYLTERLGKKLKRFNAKKMGFAQNGKNRAEKASI